MTIVAWDGESLVADTLACNQDLGFYVAKIFREGNSIIAFTGGYEQGLSLREWYRNGEDPSLWPAHQATDDWARLIVARPGQCYFYEKLPIKQIVTAPFMAWGSGRDFALGALATGASARRAVEVAIHHCITCGGEPVIFPIGEP